MLDGESDQTVDTTGDKPIPWRLIVAGVIAVAVLIFIFQNTKSQNVQFLWIDINLPLWLLFVILVAVGMAIDRLIIWRSHRSRE